MKYQKFPNIKNAEEFQNELGKFIEEAINDKLKTLMNAPVSYPIAEILFEKHEVILKDICDVVMWLYEKHGIWIYCEITKDKFYTKAKKLKSNWRRVVSGIENNKIVTYNSPTEAYEVGIKYVLTNLI